MGDFDPSDPGPMSNVDVLTVFTDRAGQRALTLRDTSLLREVGQMQAYLATLGEAGGLTVRETERWWSANPVSNLFGLAVGLLLGSAIALLFLVGAVSALRVRLAAK